MADTLLFTVESFSRSRVRSTCALFAPEAFVDRTKVLSIVVGPGGCPKSANKKIGSVR